ncbi:hypothetical protein CCACVL1_19372 [Corchorus capsularis]|uniref:Protein kinase domain-containing protein n=1 Tax=Corchorus capsularis TaxID=210143 RepID=A0A1R3HGW2_COCAP|nr:hypothetical protein CCACVL1_19372 [Corchorus capsularis]
MTSKNVIGFHLIFFLLLLCLGDAGNNSISCPVAACSENGPLIRFPFWLKGRQPENCGYPGFGLSCSNKNETMIEISNSGLLLVNHIDYNFQVIYVSDPEGCMARRLINVTGDFFKILLCENLTLLNCSSSINEAPYLWPIHCLSTSTSYVYAAYASIPPSPVILSSCARGFIANIEASYTYDCGSYSYDPGLPADFSDFFNSFSWVVPGCDNCDFEGGKCRFKSNSSRELECDEGFIESPSPSTPTYDSQPIFEGNSPNTNMRGVLIGIPLVLLIFPTATLLILLYLRSRRAKAEEIRKRINKFLEDRKSLTPTRYSFSDLQKMTNEFKKKLGQGGYGSVFKGELENGVAVAVKLLDNSKGGNGQDFTNEVSTIGRIHHVNVVRLLGYCADGSERALVYEFMQNRSLDKFIFSVNNSKRPKLSWGKLQDIAIGIARGIEYLHLGCDQRILHFDIKPQNILLDSDFNPKISDFGLAKLCPKKESVVPITAVRGTMGYIAPEVYFSGNIGNVSYKTDVYSFGMLLFEMVGGRKNKDPTVENTSQVYFPQWVHNRLADGEDLGIKEEKEGDAEIAKKLSVVALWCVQWDPTNRPSISAVIQMLEARTGSLPLPPDPFASLGPDPEESDMNVQ